MPACDCQTSWVARTCQRRRWATGFRCVSCPRRSRDESDDSIYYRPLCSGYFSRILLGGTFMRPGIYAGALSHCPGLHKLLILSMGLTRRPYRIPARDCRKTYFRRPRGGISRITRGDVPHQFSNNLRPRSRLGTFSAPGRARFCLGCRSRSTLRSAPSNKRKYGNR